MSDPLIGTRWKNRKTGNVSRITKLKGDGIVYAYLEPEFKGGRSRWKWIEHLPFDYMCIDSPEPKP